MTEVLEIALEWVRNGRAVAVATVVETWGSAPRPVGSQLVIDSNGAMEGSVSGGCVEGAVVVEAIDALADGEVRTLEYGVSDDDAFAVGLACGGTIRIMVEPVGAAMPITILEQLVEACTKRKAVAYVADLKTGTRAVVERGHGYEDRFLRDKSGFDGDAFVSIHNPLLSMIIVGAVHIAQTLVPVAQAAGFSVTVVDPRPAFGSAVRFPSVVLSEDWPDAAMDVIGIDGRTAVVTLTHDPKLDDPALQKALVSDAFYIGSLGSTRTHAKRVARLSEAGFSQAHIERIHAPVGLDIGAKSPAEIAVSIMAEVVQTLRRPA
ncbi:XdhC family protein [Thalassobium sp. R2A62]|uniref:XdhC family protein n=1 Tax=Thalassobium sp. R2A62 TaxID=633131 RepID=UPI0001B1CBD6|nr:XdhC family protein [Thalassobium sp. R2A62]EET47402.1 XdhC/CoxI family protein [Thalassobium sp. R2A62]